MAQSAPPKVKELVRVLLLPMLVGKSLILYFGAMYTANPGEGYGYGFFFSILFTLSNLGYFVWKYRHASES